MAKRKRNPVIELQGRLSPEEVRLMFKQMKKRKKSASALDARVKAPMGEKKAVSEVT